MSTLESKIQKLAEALTESRRAAHEAQRNRDMDDNIDPVLQIRSRLARNRFRSFKNYGSGIFSNFVRKQEQRILDEVRNPKGDA